MKGFSIKVQRDIMEAQNNYCRVLNCPEPIHSIHHKLRNTATNRKLYPNFIGSPMNGVGLCFSCHTNNSHLFRITDGEAKIYEDYLRELKEK